MSNESRKKNSTPEVLAYIQCHQFKSVIFIFGLSGTDIEAITVGKLKGLIKYCVIRGVIFLKYYYKY
jgi:hypothetical protein